MASFLKKLFGGGGDASEAPKAVEPVAYKGFDIYPEPIKEGAVYRIAARIEKDVEGARRSQGLVRADTASDPDQAAELSVFKAKQVIDQRGEALFDGAQA